MSIVLDADILIGALDGSDSHHKQATRLFTRWHRDAVERLISVVNLAEVLIPPAAQESSLRRARQAVAGLQVAVVTPPEAVGVEAARLRGRHAISIPDAFCLATARHLRAELASFDDGLTRAARSEGIRLAAGVAGR